MIEQSNAYRERMAFVRKYGALLTDEQLLSMLPGIAGGATNEAFIDGYKLAVVCSDPASPLSGGPVRFGSLTGVANTDKRTDGLTSVDFGPTVWNLSVKGVNDSGNVAIAAGDPLYYVDADTPKLSAKQSGVLFGFANAAVTSGATTTIQVIHALSSLGANGGIANANPAAAGNSGLRVAKATYDFAVDGGAMATITPAANATIPINAIIMGGAINNITVETSGGGATIALGLSAGGGGAAALLAAAAISGAPWSSTGIKAIIPVFSAATMIKMTAAGVITLTVATATLTAGKFDVEVVYAVGSA